MTKRTTYETHDGKTRWFNSEKAEEVGESTYHDGRNQISRATGSQWEHESLYLTADRVTWVLCHWSQWQGSRTTYREVTAEEAAAWLVVNADDEEIAKLDGLYEGGSLADLVDALGERRGARGKSEESTASETVRFRCTPAQAERIRTLATAAGQNVSEYVLSKIL